MTKQMYVGGVELQKKTNRCIEIDMIKGMGIVLMVMGHCGFPFTKYIYLFHMSIFFIASGYLYKGKDSDTMYSTCKFIFRKIKSLWLPYVGGMILFTMFHNVFIRIGILCSKENYELLIDSYRMLIVPQSIMSVKDMARNIWQALRFGGSSQLAGAFWFLKALFFVSCLYCCIDYLAKKICRKYKKYIQIGFAVLFLTCGYFFSLNNIHLHGLDMVFSIYVLFVLGRIFQEMGLKEKLQKISVAKSYLSIVFLVVCIVLLGQHGTVHLGNNQYSGPIFLIICSVSGWLLLWIVSKELMTFQSINRVLAVISKESLSILMLHFLCFKIVTVLQIMIYQQDKVLLASFPVLHSSGIWWGIYTVVGIIVPILLKRTIDQFIFSKIKRKYYE